MARIKPNEARQAQQFALNKPETFERAVPPRFPKREDAMRTMVDPTVDIDLMRAEDDGMIPGSPTRACKGCGGRRYWGDGCDGPLEQCTRCQGAGVEPDSSEPIRGPLERALTERDQRYRMVLDLHTVGNAESEPCMAERLLRWAEAPAVGERVVSLMDDLNPAALGPDARYGTVTGYDRDLHLPVITWDHPRVDVEACEPHEYEVVS